MFPGYLPMAHRSGHPRKVASPTLKGCKAFCSPPYLIARDSELTAPAVATSNCGDAPSAFTDPSSTSILPSNRVDKNFDLPPALITCLVRHTNAQHKLLATPAIVERCLRDLQRQLMPGVPVERVFGSAAPATVLMSRKTYGAAPPKDKLLPAPLNSAAPSSITTPNAGSYLAGSRVRLQLAKTTDISAVASGASVLHLLMYAVDEPESKPALLAQIAQDWRAALMRKGEGDDYLVLLVHSDLIAAAEEASRLAEEAQQSSGQVLAVTSKAPAPTTNPPALPTWGSASSASAVGQARVDAAAGQLRKYYKELRDAKFLPQQMCTYMPNETLMRILERLRSAIITHGARLRQGLEACAAQKRSSPQDPLTKPGASAAAKVSTTVTRQLPAPVTGLHTVGGASPSRAPPQPPVGAASSSPQEVHKYWSVQAFWRCGFDLAVHYLQYGLVFDARAVLERLFLEYYNSSDDYNFMRTPVTTLQKLGQVPNLFDTHRHTNRLQSKSGYPEGLNTEAELLEGLLLVTSAEMTCSLLLGDTTAAMTRYHAFMQVTREKFDEWSTADVKERLPVTLPPKKAEDNTHGPAPLNSTTYQQFFLLRCYLSALRLWWPASGLCRPRCEAAAAAAATTPSQPLDKRHETTAENPTSVLETSPAPLSPTKVRSVNCSANGGRMATVAADVNNRDDHHQRGQESAASSRSSSPISPAALADEKVIHITPASGTDTTQLVPLALLESGARPSIASLSLATTIGSGSKRPSEEHSAMRRESDEGRASDSITEPAPSVLPGSYAGIAPETDLDEDVEATVCDGGLDYLLKSCEDTVETAAAHLINLATLTGLLPGDMVPEDLLDSTQAMRDALNAGDVEAAQVLQRHQRHLRHICTEAASLLEKARDALAAVAQDLGYGHLNCPVSLASIVSSSNQAEPGSSGDDAAATTAAASFSFSNVEELSSPVKALRLWRVLTAMAALSLRIGEQRRRELDLYTQLAMTFLIDQPNVTAKIVSERLLPGTKRQGWRQIELFVRRLYVEARERLMRRAGLAYPCRTATMAEPQSCLWLRVFPTSTDYALYRECMLELLSDSSVGGGVASEDGIYSLDNRLFSSRPMTERWRELVGIDALVMGTVFQGEPCEYPLERLSSPFMVKVEHKATTTTSTLDSKADSNLSMNNLCPTTVPRGLQKADVNDVVQISLASLCTINPLARPAFPGAAEEKTVTLGAKPAVWFQLTLESRKDWNNNNHDDDDEVTHEVNICGADAVHYDEETHQLRLSFTFPVCHAGLYRLRCLRLCNGSMWLAYYPQSDISGSDGRPSGWAPSPYVAGWYASSTQHLARAIAEPPYQPLGRSTLLWVPQPRSSVHLQLTLPPEAHCFADSVDYVTLDVELEDPLPIGAPATTVASAEGLGGVTSGTCMDAQIVKRLDVAPRKQGDAAGVDSLSPITECICSYKASPGSLLLSPSPGPSGGDNTHCAQYHLGSPYWPPLSRGAETHNEGPPLQNAPLLHPSLNPLLPFREDSEANRKSNGSNAHSSTPRLVAAVVLGTPNVYRPKSNAAAARSTLGTSLLNVTMAGHGAGPPGVVVPGGGNSSTILGSSGSFSLRTPQPVDSLSLSRRGAPPSLPAPGCTHPTPFGDVHEPVHPGAVGQTSLYKSVFKSLRLSNAVEPAAPAARTAVGTLAVIQGDQILPQQQQPVRRGPRLSTVLPIPVECGAPDKVHMTGNDGFNGDSRGNRGAAASISGLGIAGEASMTPVASLLRKVPEGTLELVLVHADTAIQEDRSATATSQSAKTVAAAVTAARTVVPIHLRSFLQDIPTPEVHWNDSTKSNAVAADMSVLRAESGVSADPRRETVIRFLPNVPCAAEPATNVTGSEKAVVAVTHMRLRLPLLPLLATPISAKALENQRSKTVTSARGMEEDPAPSAAVAANQARITFTCLRGHEPCTTTLSAVIPFQAAIRFEYVFKHFQGRVYCLVKMKNLLTSTSLWLRGALLRVLDSEPSYEIVRVCEVYNDLLFREWKPQEELSILYELDLIASFHPAQPECTHQVQMEALYSSWRRTFLTTPPEERLVLRTVELPPTEITAESVEVIHSDIDLGVSGGSTSDCAVSPHGTLEATARLAGEAGDATKPTAALTSTPGTRTASHDHNDGSPAAAAHPMNCASLSRSSSSRKISVSRSSGVESQAAASRGVHFNIVTLRHLEETCNTIWGPVATFRSKHLCVFSIVMYAESPWTMRFGAATNYVAQAPSTPISLTSGAGDGAPLPRNVTHLVAPATAAPHPQPPHPSNASNLSSSFYGAPQNHSSGGGGEGDGKPGANTSLFGNAIVDPPSDFVFVAGEPVRFCVRLQPQAQNWPEDAGMEENFFIRLKYNPEQWMVIGKQRDRRTLSLMEEVTVYFNAVPLLPPTSADNDTSTAKSSEATKAVTMTGDENKENTGEDEVVGTATGTGRRKCRSVRPLAGNAVKDEGILQTPTVEMFWEQKKPRTAVGETTNLSTSRAVEKDITLAGETEADPSATDEQNMSADAVMGDAVLVDVVQFRTWVRVRKRKH
ncbi:hypothetical protein JKF63_05585 [Porcisia hertigi]|uniref:Uncharacterized protein n=1 Tax=Porcisia hertigi TaxID=2761500 RepID=A0A836I2K4_9TRYP|nr:hypothetical protein JKF63_05585 [Porcisia hertigi]